VLLTTPSILNDSNAVLQVVELVDLSVEQKQKMYLRFTKELFILNQLKHARVVPVYACTATLDELTLVMKVSVSIDIYLLYALRSMKHHYILHVSGSADSIAQQLRYHVSLRCMLIE
jgi:hypothetical protein